MIEYLQKRNQWDDAIHASVSWPAFSAARFTTVDPQFVPKHSHRHLPVGVKANRNDSKYSPACPAPECGELQETNDHFLMCSAPSRVEWRTKFQAAFSKELTRLLTDPPLQAYILETSSRLFAGRIIASTGPFQAVARSQLKIGWIGLFRGFWSSEWQEAHLRSVNGAPLWSPTDQAKRQKTQDRWLSNVNSFVMRQCHNLWLLRNNERHGVTLAQREACLHITAERELDRLYDRRPFCEPHTRTFFYASVTDHKLQPLPEIRNWFSMYETVIGISCKRQLEALPTPAGT
jgi:hypothetical protein